MNPQESNNLLNLSFSSGGGIHIRNETELQG